MLSRNLRLHDSMKLVPGILQVGVPYMLLDILELLYSRYGMITWTIVDIGTVMS
jgi:hypothetical protein